jgi:hypothetical protein
MVNPCYPTLHENIMRSCNGDCYSIINLSAFHFRCFRLFLFQALVMSKMLWVLPLRGTMEEGSSVACVASTIIWPSWARLMLFLQHIYEIGLLCVSTQKLTSGTHYKI